MPFRMPPRIGRSITGTGGIPALVFVVALGCGQALVHVNQTLHAREREFSTRQLIDVRASDIERNLSFALASTYILAQEVIRSGGDVVDFDGYAASVLTRLPDVSNLQLAPDGIIRQVHPLAGNEAAIGHDILRDDARREEARAAVASCSLTLAGPFPLLQGGMGMVGRNPVFLETDGEPRFWGFASALILLDHLLDRVDLAALSARHLAYELGRTDPETGEVDVFASSARAVPEGAPSADIRVPNGTWFLRAGSPEHDSMWLWGVGQALSFGFAGLLAAFALKVVREPENLRRQVAAKTAELRELAYHDALTGLPNRLNFVESMDESLARVRGARAGLHLMLMDIDHFKEVNDLLGHEIGDRLLIESARRIEHGLPASATLCRLGGDEFTVILDGPMARDEVELVAAGIVEALAAPFHFDGEEARVSASVGIVGSDHVDADTRDMLKAADIAMYEAKRLGRARFAWHVPANADAAGDT